jgi:hypothetical protein
MAQNLLNWDGIEDGAGDGFTIDYVLMREVGISQLHHY